jgi:PilZ domain-containing protein
MIPRSERRMIDERTEVRHPSLSNTGVLEFRGRKHMVRLINVSSSGAMIAFPHSPNIGERLLIQVLDHGAVWAQVRWVKDGRVGLSFAAPLD